MNCKEFKKMSAFVWWFAVISLTILLDHCIRRALYLPKRALPGKVCLPKEVSTHKFSPLLEETPNKEKKQTYLPRNRQPCEIPVLEMEEIHRELLLERNSVLFSQSEYSKVKQCYPTVIFRGGNSTSASPGDRQVADGLRPVNFVTLYFFLFFQPEQNRLTTTPLTPLLWRRDVKSAHRIHSRSTKIVEEWEKKKGLYLLRIQEHEKNKISLDEVRTKEAALLISSCFCSVILSALFLSRICTKVLVSQIRF